MAGSINKVIIVGNLGRDPEVRHGQDGFKVVSLAIATGESWKDKTTGEKRERTEWHRVSIINPALGDIAERYLRKGSKVYIEGQLQTSKWTDQNGQERYSTDIVLRQYRGELALLDSPNKNGGAPAATPVSALTSDLPFSAEPLYETFQSPQPSSASKFEMRDDEIPF